MCQSRWVIVLGWQGAALGATVPIECRRLWVTRDMDSAPALNCDEDRAVSKAIAADTGDNFLFHVLTLHFWNLCRLFNQSF
jgi:hypothetical protein